MKKLVPQLSLILFITIIFIGSLRAQNPVAVKAQVVDELGAIIPGARATLIAADSKKRTAIADAGGELTIPNVAPGIYTLTIEFKGFQAYVENNIRVPLSASPLKIVMKVAPVSVETEVTADASGVSVEPDQNLNAIVLDEQMIMDLIPNNEDDMRDFLLGLAGPAAGGSTGGQGGAQIYVDGFSGGRLPPREAILQIRINQNPFSAEYAHPGAGRIEIITKPGTEQWHGSAGFGASNAIFNARNAFALLRPDLDQRRYSYTLSGPIIKKRMSFFFNGEQRRVNSDVIINAKTLNGDFISNVPSENENRSYGLRLGFTLNNKNSLSTGYSYHQSQRLSNGGGFTLPDRGSANENTNHTVTISETFLINARMVHETRMRVQHEESTATAKTLGVAINVLDAFNSGGATCCPTSTRQDQIDFQDYLTFTLKRHTLRGGFQLQYENNRDLAASNSNGTYTFSSLDQYRAVLAGEHTIPGDLTSPLVRPTQFTINVGNPILRYNQYEASVFIQDDFRMRQSFTLSLGLRYEFQKHLADHLNFAPRLGIAWSPFKDRKTTVRTGAGIFFNRLPGSLYENTLRFDGITQQSFVIRNPVFDLTNPLAANPGATADLSRVIKRTLDPSIVAPYTINFTSSFEHQFPRGFSASLTHIYTRGIHFFRSRNINAPLPVTGLRPDPSQGNIYEIESAANSRYNGLMFRADRRFSRSFSIFTNYTLSWTNSDADGSLSLPADSYNLRPEWGRAATDRRHYLFAGGTLTLPHDLRFSPLVQFNSGGPFNITTGADDNRDTVINDRPGGINRNSDLPASLYSLLSNRCLINCQSGATPVMLLDYLTAHFPNGVRAIGPGSFNVNLSITKTFGLGKRIGGNMQANNGSQSDDGTADGDQTNARGGRRGGGGRGGGFGGGGGRRGGGGGGGRGGGRRGTVNESSRYNIQISAQITNLLNNVNFGQYSGVLTSPFFGQSSNAGPARHMEFNLRFSF